MNAEAAISENNAPAIIENETGALLPAVSLKSVAKMDKVAAGLADMKAEYEDMPDVSTSKGYALADKQRKAIKAVRVSVDHAHKEGKAPITALGKKLDAQRTSIKDAMEKWEQDRIDAIKKIDDEKERIKRERTDTIKARIDAIKATKIDSVTIEQIDASLALLAAIDLDEFEEFKDAAEMHRDASSDVLTDRRAALEAQEAETSRLAEQKAEQDRQAAELKVQQDKIAEDARILAESTAAAAKAESDRLAAIAAEDAERAARIKHEDDAREAAETARQAAIQREKNEKAASERKAIEDAAAAKKAEEDQAAAIVAAAEKAAQDERERIAAEAVAESERLAEEKAAAERAALDAPDAEKIKLWMESIKELPIATGAKGKARIKKIAALVYQIKAA